MMNEGEVTEISDDHPGAGSRRGALAAMLAGTALGLSSLGGVGHQDAEGKGKKGKKKSRRKNRHGGNGKGGNGGVGGSLPSVRFVYTTTTTEGNGIAIAYSQCPLGYLPISGGFFTSTSEPALMSSNPRLAKNDWEIAINGASDAEQLTVIAVCLAASDDSR